MVETVNILRKDLKDLLNQIDLLEHSLATRVQETGAVLLTEKQVMAVRFIADFLRRMAGTQVTILHNTVLQEYANELLAALPPEKRG